MAFGPLVIIGAGAMASAIVRGAIDAGELNPHDVSVCDPGEEVRRRWAALGAFATPDHAEAIARLPGAPVLLAVKPQMLPDVSAQASSALTDGRLVVSILAGTTLASLRAALGPASRYVRVMPNTPAAVREGCCAIVPAPDVSADEAARVEALFRAVAPVVVRLDESLMDAFTGVAGSGPAYLFLLGEAMTRGAIEAGLDPKDAPRIVNQTLLGASRLLVGEQGQADAGELRRRVTSKGGTTAAALNVLGESGVADAVVRAIAAARDRGRELGRG